MASLLFRPIDFCPSTRHPSHLDLDLDPFSRGVSPTSSPFPMSPAGTSNPFGNAANLPTPPPLTMGELAVKFGEQSLHHLEEQACVKSSTSGGTMQLHHSLPTPPAEEDCTPNDVTGGLPPRHRQTSISRVQYSPTRRRSSSSDRAGESLRNYPSSSTSPLNLSSISAPGLPLATLYSTYPRAADYEDLLLSPTSNHATPWDLRRRRSTSALRPAYWTDAAMEALEALASRPGGGSMTPNFSGRGRGRRIGEERRRGDDCGISKAGRYRRGGLGRRGAVST